MNATLSSSLTLHIKYNVECKIHTFHVMFLSILSHSFKIFQYIIYVKSKTSSRLKRQICLKKDQVTPGFDSSWGLRIFLCSTLVTRHKNINLQI